MSHTTAAAGKTGSVIAVLGVAFAVAIMEVTMSVSIGFKQEITSKLQGFIAPVTVYPTNSDESVQTLIDADSTVFDIIKDICPDATPVKLLVLQGMLKTEDDFQAIALKAYDGDYDADFEKSILRKGKWIDDEENNSLVLSSRFADKLGLTTGDKINLCYFVNDRIKSRPFKITGLYESGLSEYDDIIGYADYNTLKRIYHASDSEASVIEIRNIGIDQAENVGEELKQRFITESLIQENPELALNVGTITRQGAMYLNWLELLDTNVVVIFVLMALVAFCTLISALFIQVLEKVNMIGLLKAIGTTNATISQIFIWVSLKLVGLGILTGNILGLGFIFIQEKWHPVSLNPDMYYLDTVPVSFNLSYFLILNVCVALASWLILLLPARIATRLSPASTLRFD